MDANRLRPYKLDTALPGMSAQDKDWYQIGIRTVSRIAGR